MKIYSAKNRSCLRSGIRALKHAHNTKNETWEGLRYLTEMSKEKIKVLPSNWLYGTHNNPDDLDARARLMVFKYALGSKIFWQVPNAIFDKQHSIITRAPRVWRNRLLEFGLNVPKIKNDFNWFVRQLRFLVSSLFTAARMTKFSWQFQNFQPTTPFWIADRFPLNSLPSIDKEISDMRLVPYLAKNYVKHGQNNQIWAVVSEPPKKIPEANFVSSPHIFPALDSYFNTLGFLGTSLMVVVFSLFKWLLGSTGSPALTEDAIVLQYFKRLTKQQLPTSYIVTNSGCGAKPLWVNEAEARGVQTSMVFYSTNNRVMQFDHQKMPPPFNPEHLLMNWSRFIVRDHHQADWVRSVVRTETKICELGAMPLEDNGQPLPVIPSNAISVFDITPVRDSYFILIGERYSVLTDQYITSFWDDLIEVSENLGISYAVKFKREKKSWMLTPKYMHTVRRIKANPKFVMVDSGVAALRLIQKTSAAITLPYTSTAIDAHILGKPSIYYDPSGILKNINNENHGVPIVRGKEQLRKWLLDLNLAS